MGDDNNAVSRIQVIRVLEITSDVTPVPEEKNLYRIESRSTGRVECVVLCDEVRKHTLNYLGRKFGLSLGDFYNPVLAFAKAAGDNAVQ